MRIPEFTPAEKRVVRLISLGLSTREVAHVLGKAESTVDNQRTSAMRSAEITTATELVRVALLSGVTTLEDALTPSERRKLSKLRGRRSSANRGGRRRKAGSKRPTRAKKKAPRRTTARSRKNSPKAVLSKTAKKKSPTRPVRKARPKSTRRPPGAKRAPPRRQASSRRRTPARGKTCMRRQQQAVLPAAPPVSTPPAGVSGGSITGGNAAGGNSDTS